MIVDHDALVDLHVRTLEPVEVRPDAGRHDHDVGDQVTARGHLEPPPSFRIVDPGELGARAHRDTVFFEPRLDEPGAGRVDHSRQDPRLHYHERLPGAERAATVDV